MIKEEITLPVHRDGKQIYDIKIHKDFAGLPECIGCLGDLSGSRICVVTDSNVSRLYAQEVLELLQPVCRETFLYTLPAGKNIRAWRRSAGFTHICWRIIWTGVMCLWRLAEAWSAT